MKHPFIFLLGVILILNLMSFKTSSNAVENLIKENQKLKERLSLFEKTDNSSVRAVVELNKMNVVYRGIVNPLIISMPNALKFEASAPGLKKIDEFGHYELSPGSGLTVDVVIKGILENGDNLTEIKTLRIKNINKPVGTFNHIGHHSDCPLEFTKESLMDGKVGVRIEDYLFDLDYSLKSFKIQKNKNTAISVNGNVLNEEAKHMVKKAKTNDNLYIFDIKLNNPSNVCLPLIAPIKIKIVN